jgi:arylsulfatase A-like enzyme
MKVEADLDYTDLGLVQPEGGREVGELHSSIMKSIRKVPSPATDDEVKTMRLIDRDTAEVFTFNSKDELKHFKYQRYMKRYLRSIQSIDDSVGEILDYLDQNDLSQDTIVIYTSDQGFFL